MPTTTTVELDVAVIGGGIAGLWLINRLLQIGYNAALFESKVLGSDQTIASQGMIHGGIKYTLGGAFSGASEAIADMPQHWSACLRGEGDVDLRKARVLSDHFYMWSSPGVTSRLSTFLASKAARGRVEAVKPAQRPAIFRHPGFSGRLYRLVDLVLDVPSVLAALADNASGKLFKLNRGRHSWIKTPEGSAELHISPDMGPHTGELVVKAKRFIFTAGKGNAELLQALGANQPQMQLRPLRQVMVKHNAPYTFFGHCLGADKTPRLTISSHPASEGQIWYLGGNLAEKGACQSDAEVISRARDELTRLLPWVDLGQAQWAALAIERAEPKQRNLVRPDKAFAEPAQDLDNVIVAWPTKLTLAPNLAAQALGLIGDQALKPSGPQVCAAFSALSPPPIAVPPWVTAFDGPQALEKDCVD